MDAVGIVVAAVVVEEELANDVDEQDSGKSCCCWKWKGLTMDQEQVVVAFAGKCCPYFLMLPPQSTTKKTLMELLEDYFGSCKPVLLF